MTKLWPALLLILLTLPFVIVLTTANVWVFSFKVYENHYTPDIYDYFSAKGYGSQEINLITLELLSYLGNRADNTLDTPPGFFTEDEASHFADVRALMLSGRQLLLASGVILLIGLSLLFGLSYFVMRAYWLSYGLKYLGVAMTVSSIIMLLAGCLAFIAFDNFSSTFQNFHAFLFPQGNYTFPLDSNMIQLFPEAFFKQMGERIVLTAAITAIVLLITGILLSRSGPLWLENQNQ